MNYYAQFLQSYLGSVDMFLNIELFSIQEDDINIVGVQEARTQGASQRAAPALNVLSSGATSSGALGSEHWLAKKFGAFVGQRDAGGVWRRSSKSDQVNGNQT